MCTWHPVGVPNAPTRHATVDADEQWPIPEGMHHQYGIQDLIPLV